jgi:hypothetical protein
MLKELLTLTEKARGQAGAVRETPGANGFAMSTGTELRVAA